MSSVRPRMSYADLERMPDDGTRYELYDGEVFVMPAPIPRHQRVAFNVATVMSEYEHAHGGLMFVSPIDIVLDDHNVVQPDVVYFAPERTTLVDMRRAIRVPPDLAVEVLSPGTIVNDRGRKLQLLARFGVPEYWLVDPIENTIERYGLEGGAYALDAVVFEADTMASRALAGFTCPAARFFTT